MVLYVSVGLGNPRAPDRRDKRALPKNQPQALSLFLAWSSAVLIVLAMGTLFSSVFFDTPVHLRTTFFPNPEAAAISGPETEERYFWEEEQKEVQEKLKTKTITDPKVRALFQEQSIKVKAVKFLIFTSEKSKQIVKLQIWCAFGTYAVLWCDLKETDPDFALLSSLVRSLLDKSS